MEVRLAYTGRVGAIALVAVDSFADDLAVDVSELLLGLAVILLFGGSGYTVLSRG